MTSHLWECDRPPSFGAKGFAQQFGSFPELREWVNDADPDLCHVYRFDWDQMAPETDTLTVYVVELRRHNIRTASCPVDRDQEPEVVAWLMGDRVMGRVRRMWAPLLDAVAGQPGEPAGGGQ